MNMKKLILFSITVMFGVLSVFSQTPYDNFAPEQSVKSMIELPQTQFTVENTDSTSEIRRVEFDKNTLSLNLLDEDENVIKTLVFNPDEKKFLTIDPFAEKYYSISPYAYCMNNPVKYVDPDGRTIQVYDYVNNQRVGYEWKDYQGTWGFYDNNNTLYAGNNAFIGQLSGTLTGLMNGGSEGFDLVSRVANHSNVVTLMYSDRSGVDSQNQLGWNPTGVRRDGSLEAVPTTTGMRNDPMITLGHELGHVDYNWNVGSSATWFNITVADRNGNPTQRPISTSEIYTTHIENQLRSENNLPLRTYYGVDPSGRGIGPRIIVPSTGASRYYNSQGFTNYRPLRRGVTPYIY